LSLDSCTLRLTAMSNWTSAVATTTSTRGTKPNADELLASLTVSFNRNHISQEAVNLDILQAQLKEALFHAGTTGRSASHQPPNTPTQTIGTLTYSNSDGTWSKHSRGPRGTRSKSTSLPGESEDLMMIDEEEEEVEDLLGQSHLPPTMCHPQCTSPNRAPHQCHLSISPISSFTATDPFYEMSDQSQS